MISQKSQVSFQSDNDDDSIMSHSPMPNRKMDRRKAFLDEGDSNSHLKLIEEAQRKLELQKKESLSSMFESRHNYLTYGNVQDVNDPYMEDRREWGVNQQEFEYRQIIRFLI